MKLSDQAIGCLMLALQKSLLEQVDIVPMLKEFDFAEMDNKQLLVENPPDIKVGVPLSAKPTSPEIKTSEKETPRLVYGASTDFDA